MKKFTIKDAKFGTWFLIIIAVFVYLFGWIIYDTFFISIIMLLIFRIHLDLKQSDLKQSDSKQSRMDKADTLGICDRTFNINVKDEKS